ncbi:hypothetical protein ACX1N5_05450 [Acinetobacter sp. ANC 4636]
MQDPMSESQSEENEPSFWKEVLAEAFVEFLPNLVMGIFRPIAHFLGEVFNI